MKIDILIQVKLMEGWQILKVLLVKITCLPVEEEF